MARGMLLWRDVRGDDPREPLSEPAYRPELANRFHRGMELFSRLLRARVEGLEQIPTGRALIVGNHCFGWDVALPMAAVHQRLGRQVWVLGEHLWRKVPVARELAAAIGLVDGTPENADRLLGHDELALVLPGGLREAVKPRELRYHLLWGRRLGFIRASVRNQAPIVPLASLGADDLFDLVGDAYARGEKWLHLKGIPIPLPRRLLPIPHRTSFRFSFGEPISPPPITEIDNEVTLHRFRREVEGAIHELLEKGLAERAGLQIE